MAERFCGEGREGEEREREREREGEGEEERETLGTGATEAAGERKRCRTLFKMVVD